jgi:hypothetical protein
MELLGALVYQIYRGVGLGHVVHPDDGCFCVTPQCFGRNIVGFLGLSFSLALISGIYCFCAVGYFAQVKGYDRDPLLGG